MRKKTKHAIDHRVLIAVCMAWIAVGLFHGLSRYADIVKYQLDVAFSGKDLVYYVLSYSLWIAVTLLLIKLFQKYTPLSRMFLIGAFIIGLNVWLPVYFAMDFAISSASEGGGTAAWLTKMQNINGSLVFFYAVVYTLTFVACLGIVLFEQQSLAQQQNAQLKHQQTIDRLKLSEQNVQLLQSQLSPHFLFNCLGAISGLARSDERTKLIEAIAKIGNLLRFTVHNASVTFITLEEELKFSNDYLALQSLRFADRVALTSTINIDDGAIMCPPFCIQPLLENAYRHGVETSNEQIAIALSVIQQGDRINVEVVNTLSSNRSTQKSEGTALKNLYSRLNYCYKSRFSMEYGERTNGFYAQLSLPTEVSS